jgi:hypothetical protein
MTEGNLGKNRVSRADRLINRYVEPGPAGKHPIADAVLGESHTSVWMVVNYVKIHRGRLGPVENDYGLPIDQIRAAMAFYRREGNRKYIDARRLLSSDFQDGDLLKAFPRGNEKLRFLEESEETSSSPSGVTGFSGRPSDTLTDIINRDPNYRSLMNIGLIPLK